MERVTRKRTREQRESVALRGGIACPPGQISLWRDRSLCDVTITVDGTKFVAHRTVLAATSEYMRGLFTSEMRDSEMREITLPEMPASIFSAVLEWIYTGTVHHVLDFLLLMPERVFHRSVRPSRSKHADDAARGCEPPPPHLSATCHRKCHPRRCEG